MVAIILFGLIKLPAMLAELADQYAAKRKLKRERRDAVKKKKKMQASKLSELMLQQPLTKQPRKHTSSDELSNYDLALHNRLSINLDNQRLAPSPAKTDEL